MGKTFKDMKPNKANREAIIKSTKVNPLRVTDEFDNDYYIDRQVCPECYSTRIVISGTNTSIVDFDDHVDCRKTVCESCGWRGIFDDLVPNIR